MRKYQILLLTILFCSFPVEQETRGGCPTAWYAGPCYDMQVMDCSECIGFEMGGEGACGDIACVGGDCPFGHVVDIRNDHIMAPCQDPDNNGWDDYRLQTDENGDIIAVECGDASCCDELNCIMNHCWRPPSCPIVVWSCSKYEGFGYCDEE